jgi:hypothetical protein
MKAGGTAPPADTNRKKACPRRPFSFAVSALT